jgi:hypothetical protein
LQRWQDVCYRGSSMCILVDGTSKYVLYPTEGVLEYGCYVLYFDHDCYGQQCAKDGGNSKDSWDAGLYQ